MIRHKFLLMLLCITFSMQVFSQEDKTDILDMSIKELMNIEARSASKFDEFIDEIPATMLIITKEEIKDRGYVSLNEIIHDIPGYDIAAPYSDFTQIQYARGNRTGSYNERTIFLVNGIEQNLLYCQGMNIAEDFPLSVIERIEFLYGPASAIYGPNAFSGIINVITKNASKLEEDEDDVQLGIGGGSNTTTFADVTYLAKYGPVGLSLSYRRFHSNRFDISGEPGYFTNEEIIGNPRIWGPYAELYPKYENRADDFGIIAKMNYKNIEIGFNKLETVHGNGSEYPYDKTLPTLHWNFFRDVLYTRIKKELNDKLSISFLANYDRNGSGPESIWAQGVSHGNTWDAERTVELRSWKYISHKYNLFQDFVFKANENIILSGSFKYAKANHQTAYHFGYSDKIRFDTDSAHKFQNPDTLAQYDLFPPLFTKNKYPGNTFNENEWGGYLQAKIVTFDEKLYIVGGARYDYNDIYGDAINPRVGFIYKLMGNKLYFKTNYGTAFHSPAPRNMYGSWGGLKVNPDLQSEEISSFDFGINSITKNISNDITFFQNNITNTVLQGENLPNKTIYGMEYKFNHLVNLGNILKRLKLHFNYSYILPKWDKEISNNTTGRTSKYVGDIAKHKFNLIFDTDWIKKLHWNLRFNYVGERQTIVSNPVKKIDPYFITNTSFRPRDLKHYILPVFAS